MKKLLNNLRNWLENLNYPKDNVDSLMWKCYTELFAKSSPNANFQVLVDTAELNERGQKVIPFMDYEIDVDVYDKIVKKYSKRVRPKYKQKAFEISIALGCSPKHKLKDEYISIQE